MRALPFSRLLGAGAALSVAAAAFGSTSKDTLRTRKIVVPSEGGWPECSLLIREQRMPPPIGMVVWPASHVMLHGILPGVGKGAVVLEMGSGCGLVAVGLAKLCDECHVIASDRCDASLENCRFNVELNSVADKVSVTKWDIASGSPPCDMKAVTHLIAADVVYHGAGGEVLVEELHRLLGENPHLHVWIVLVDRFSGGAFAAVSGVAGTPNVTVTARVDPQIVTFERAAAAAGLQLVQASLGKEAEGRLLASMSMWERARWALLGMWDGFRIYRVSVGASP